MYGNVGWVLDGAVWVCGVWWGNVGLVGSYGVMWGQVGCGGVRDGAWGDVLQALPQILSHPTRSGLEKSSKYGLPTSGGCQETQKFITSTLLEVPTPEPKLGGRRAKHQIFIGHPINKISHQVNQLNLACPAGLFKFFRGRP